MAARKKKKRPVFQNDALSSVKSSDPSSSARFSETESLLVRQATRGMEEFRRQHAEASDDIRYNRGPRRPADTPSHARIHVRDASGEITRIERPEDQYRGVKKKKIRGKKK